jgi:hypothetical protein
MSLVEASVEFEVRQGCDDQLIRTLMLSHGSLRSKGARS